MIASNVTSALFPGTCFKDKGYEFPGMCISPCVGRFSVGEPNVI
jgi:hypothetical protein